MSADSTAASHPLDLPPPLPLTPPALQAQGAPQSPPSRLASIDTYRGFVMLLMMAEVLSLSRLAKAFPEVPWIKFLAFQQSHVEWRGCTLHDMIQPSFSFLVGVSLIFSFANRQKRGESYLFSLFHATWRALLLVFLGIFLRSVGRPQANYTFEDTLTQIGLGYLPLFLIASGSKRFWSAALVAILVGYWILFAIHPLPGPDFEYVQPGLQEWVHNESGFAAHWNKNTNPAWTFDRWFLNLFPRATPFEYNGGGYATLSFIPTLATMILGLFAGDLIRSSWSRFAKWGWMLIAGVVGVSTGYALDYFGVCPSVKRIWTPSWVLFSGGWCFLLLALFYLLTDLPGWSTWAYPLRVIGMNSIAAYMISHLIEGFLRDNIRTFFGKGAFKVFGDPYEALFYGVVILLIYWLILFWMDRRKLYLRV